MTGQVRHFVTFVSLLISVHPSPVKAVFFFVRIEAVKLVSIERVLMKIFRKKQPFQLFSQLDELAPPSRRPESLRP